MATCGDGWFRPVDLKAGPDGAIYVADFYESRISHVDPRDTWDRSTGRIWRIRPAEWKLGLKSFDLSRESTADLLGHLRSDNRWTRGSARRVLADRGDLTAVPALRRMLSSEAGAPALEALWTLNALGALDEQAAMIALNHREPSIRMWAVRLLGDTKDKAVAPNLLERLLDLATRETEAQVRSQLASTARRLPAEQAMQLVRRMLARDEDASDVHIPLLLWWAVEDKSVSHRDQVVSAFMSAEIWHERLARQTVLPRLARRYAAQPTAENQQALVKLLGAAPGEAERDVLLSGIKEGFVGLPLRQLIPPLATALAASGDPELRLRLGDADAHERALRFVADECADPQKRIRFIELLGQVRNPAAVPALLDLADNSRFAQVKTAALSALSSFGDPDIARRIVRTEARLPAGSDARNAAVATLLGRPAWTVELLRGIEGGAIPRSDVGITQMERIRQYDDPAVRTLVDKLFGRLVPPTSQQKQQEIARVTHLVTTGSGDAQPGKVLFTQRCAVCHTLFGQGGKVGPDLTGYERRNVDFLVLSVVDPSAYIREEYTAFRIRTRDGQTFIGLITDRGPNQITLEDASQQKTVVPKEQIIEERALPTSLMPEGLLDGLSDQQVRDLFKYLASEKPAG